jgi:surfactin synthase thioesterase subunit
VNPWLPGFDRSARPRLRLFALPCAGRGAAQYASWARLLPPEVQLCPIQLPGRESRAAEPPATDLVGLAAQLVPAVAPLLETPFAVFGHSMGALLGFELSRALRATFGIEPVHLVVAAGPPPQHEHTHRPGPEEIAAQVAASLAGVPDGPERDEALAHATRVLAADTEMCRTYAFTPAAPLDCPVTAIHAESDPGVPAALMAGWSVHTTGAFTQLGVAGDHFIAESWATLPSVVLSTMGSLT